MNMVFFLAKRKVQLPTAPSRSTLKNSSSSWQSADGRSVVLGVMFNEMKVPHLLHRTGSPRRSRTHKSFTTSVCNGQSTKKRKKPRASLYPSIHPSIYLQSWPKLCGTRLQNALPRPYISFSHGKKKDISICLSVRPSVRPSVCLSVCLSICLFIYLSILYIYYPLMSLHRNLSMRLSLFAACLRA